MLACGNLYLSTINIYKVDQNPNSCTGFKFCVYNVPNARAFCQSGAFLNIGYIKQIGILTR